MRLLASMNTLMNSEGRALNKLFATAGIVANMWADSAVDSFCRLLLIGRTERCNAITHHGEPSHYDEQSSSHKCCKDMPLAVVRTQLPGTYQDPYSETNLGAPFQQVPYWRSECVKGRALQWVMGTMLRYP